MILRINLWFSLSLWIINNIQSDPLTNTNLAYSVTRLIDSYGYLLASAMGYTFHPHLRNMYCQTLHLVANPECRSLLILDPECSIHQIIRYASGLLLTNLAVMTLGQLVKRSPVGDRGEGRGQVLLIWALPSRDAAAQLRTSIPWT